MKNDLEVIVRYVDGCSEALKVAQEMLNYGTPKEKKQAYGMIKALDIIQNYVHKK